MSKPAPKITKPTLVKSTAKSTPTTQLPHEVLGLTQADMLADWSTMQLCRRFEEKAAGLYQQAHIAGFCHLYIGQEACLIGAKRASDMRKAHGGLGDDFITSYRCHAHAIVCGITPEAVMAELTGRGTGISKGKGGSMHMFEPDLRFWGGHGIVTAQLPLGTGLAFAAKYRAENRACLTFMGDGAINAGQAFESFNMAALWHLPVVYVIENNQYGMGTKVARAAAGDLSKRGEPFGIPGQKVDGMDYFAVTAAFQHALAEAVQGRPQLLELDTYRYRGHSMSDPAKYRTREDVDCVKEARDPITRLQTYLQQHFGIADQWFEQEDEKIKEHMNRVAEHAITSPEPAPAELYTDIIPS